MKDPMIRAARLWFQSYDRYPHDEVMPTTPMGIYMRLAKLRAENEKRRQRHRSLVV
jgi:hypothetical protein